MNRTDLSKKMHALAEQGHPRAAELLEKAKAFDTATEGFYAEPQRVSIQGFMGSWARARMMWCECTGEDMV